MSKKSGFVVLGIVCFCLSFMDYFAWNGSSEGSFPFCSFCSLGLAFIFGPIILIMNFVRISKKSDNTFRLEPLVCFGGFFLGFIGAFLGMIVSGMLVY